MHRSLFAASIIYSVGMKTVVEALARNSSNNWHMALDAIDKLAARALVAPAPSLLEERKSGAPIWVASATHDVAIEVAKEGRLINHRIDPDVDAERDFVGIDLTNTSSISRQEYLQSTDPVFQAETATCQAYHSDSRVLLLNLHPLTSPKTGTTGQPSALLRTTSMPITAPPN